MDKNNTLKKLIKRLNSSKLPDEVASQIIKLGKPTYDYLWTIVDDPNLSDYQVINLLVILNQMKFHNIELFVNKLLSFTQDTRIDVRSRASWLAICLFRLKQEFKELNIPLQREILGQFLSKASSMELHSSSVIQQFLAWWQYHATALPILLVAPRIRTAGLLK